MTSVVGLAVAALLLAGIRCAYTLGHPLVWCRCGALLGRMPARRATPYEKCVRCRERERRDLEAQRQMHAARRRAEREYAAAESARIEGRFPVRRAGTFGVLGGAFVLDGWVFEDPRAVSDAAAPAATGPARLTLSRYCVVYGWRLEELHALAHGSFCTCLKR